jgi:hypothetical protein
VLSIFIRNTQIKKRKKTDIEEKEFWRWRKSLECCDHKPKRWATPKGKKDGERLFPRALEGGIASVNSLNQDSAPLQLWELIYFVLGNKFMVASYDNVKESNIWLLIETETCYKHWYLLFIFYFDLVVFTVNR